MTKTRTGKQLMPGMVVRAQGVDTEGTRLDIYREVASAKHFAYSDKIVTFTDGTRVRVGKDREFEMTRSKAVRNATKRRAASIPIHALAGVLSLLGSYAFSY